MSAVVKAVKSVAKTVSKAVKTVVNTVVNTAKAIIKDPLPTIISLAGQAVGIPMPITQAAIAGARGGDLGDMAKAATIAYVAPMAASKVASAIAPNVSSAITNEAAAKAVTNATSKALVNGSIAAATGGDFGEAAAGTMAGSLAASGYQNFVAPSVVAKAQDMGISLDDSKNLSAALRTGVAAGTATAVAGGDFASSFATAVAEEGIEGGLERASESIKTSSFGESLRASPIGEAAKKITETYDNVTDSIENAFKKKNVATSEPLGNGVPTALVNEVPVSPNAEPGIVADADGKAIGKINPASNDAAYNQLVEAFEAPKTPSKQFGVATAQAPAYDSEGRLRVEIFGTAESEAAKQKKILETKALFGLGTPDPDSPYKSLLGGGASGKNFNPDGFALFAIDGGEEPSKVMLELENWKQEAKTPEQKKAVDDAIEKVKDIQIRSAIDGTSAKDAAKAAYSYDVINARGVVKDADEMVAEIASQKAMDAAKAETSSDILKTITAQSPTTSVPTPKPVEYTQTASVDDPTKDLQDLKNLYKASTGTALVPSAVPSLPELQQKVEEAKTEVSNAAVDASVAPTPDNTQKFNDAQANLELAQKAYDNAAAQVQEPDIKQPIVPPLPEPPSAPVLPSLPELEAAAQQAKAEAVDAAVTAQALPTPENEQAARDAQLNAELAQAALNEATKEPVLVPGPPAEPAPSATVGTTFPGQVPAEIAGQPTTFTPPTELPPVAMVEGELQPSTIGGITQGAGVTGGLGALSPEAGVAKAGSLPGGMPEGVPGGVPGGVADGTDTGLPGGGEEGIPQLPEVEVLGEDGKPAGPSSSLGGLRRFPVITYNYLGEPVGRRIIRRSPLNSLLDTSDKEKGVLGDLGSGVTFIDQPLEWLEPSLLARGGLIRFRRT